VSDPGAACALLLLDLQEAICREDGEVGRLGHGRQVAELGVLERAAWSLRHARERGTFIAYSRLAFDPQYSMLTSSCPRLHGLRAMGLLQAGTEGAAICSEIAPEPGDLVVEKTGIDPFIGTRLFPALFTRGITRIALAGVATEHVVESAARHAADLGLQVTVLSDACCSQTPELRAHALEQTLPFYATVSPAADVFVAGG
jgi:nicotinamidase-related amidase